MKDISTLLLEDIFNEVKHYMNFQNKNIINRLPEDIQSTEINNQQKIQQQFKQPKLQDQQYDDEALEKILEQDHRKFNDNSIPLYIKFKLLRKGAEKIAIKYENIKPGKYYKHFNPKIHLIKQTDNKNDDIYNIVNISSPIGRELFNRKKNASELVDEYIKKSKSNNYYTKEAMSNLISTIYKYYDMYFIPARNIKIQQLYIIDNTKKDRYSYDYENRRNYGLSGIPGIHWTI